MNDPMCTQPFKRVLVLANKPPGLAPGQRFRFEQWAPRLKRNHNIELELLPFESPPLTKILYARKQRLTKARWAAFDFLRRLEVLFKLHHYDAVLVFREAALIGPAVYEHLIAWSGKPIIFDFDDAIWRPQDKGNILSRLHFHKKTKSICRLARAVTAGNEYLADYARQWNNQVTIVPTSIELAEYPISLEPKADRPFVICWSGSSSTLPHLENGRTALELLAQQLPLAVKVICNEPPKKPIAGAEMRFVPWSQETEAREIGDSHVGIMPLPDDEFTRGKCGLKALQCMATGRPVVISPVGMNTELVRSGENGILASTPLEYVESLLQLANAPDLRARMGKNARRTVEQDYSARAVAAKFAAVIRTVTG